MSSFICDKCGEPIIDTANGYTTQCEHYPIKREREEKDESK